MNGFNLRSFLSNTTNTLNKGLDAGKGNYGMKFGEGFNSPGFDVGINPLSVAQVEGQLIPGTIASTEGPLVSAGPLGRETKALGEQSKMKSALGEVLLQGGKSMSQKRSPSVSMSSTGGGQLGRGLRFEDLYNVKF